MPEHCGSGLYRNLDTALRSLVDATNFVRTVEQHQHRKIACREIIYLNGWISKNKVDGEVLSMKRRTSGPSI